MVDRDQDPDDMIAVPEQFASVSEYVAALERGVRDLNQRVGHLTVFLTFLARERGGMIMVDVEELKTLPKSAHVTVEKTADGSTFIIAYVDEAAREKP
jgi:hypothetical protein